MSSSRPATEAFPRPLELNLDPLGDPPRLLLTGPRRLRVELHLQGRGPPGEGLGTDLRRGRRQDLVGPGRIFRSEGAGAGGDDRPALGVDQAGRHALQRPRQPGRQVGRRVDPPSGFQPADQQFRRQLDAGEFPRAAADADAAGLRGLEFLLAAAGELGDGPGLQVMIAVLQPPLGLEHADELVVGQPRQVGARLLGQRGQHRARPQHVRGGVLAELRAEPVPAQTLRPAYSGQDRRIDVGSVTKAQRDRRTVDLPRLGRPLATACGDLPLAPRHVRVPLRVRPKTPTGKSAAAHVLRRRAGPGQLALVHVLVHVPALLPDDHGYQSCLREHNNEQV